LSEFHATGAMSVTEVNTYEPTLTQADCVMVHGCTALIEE